MPRTQVNFVSPTNTRHMQTNSTLNTQFPLSQFNFYLLDLPVCSLVWNYAICNHNFMPENINSNTDPEMSLLTMQKGLGKKNLACNSEREKLLSERGKISPLNFSLMLTVELFPLSSCLSLCFLLLAKAALQSLPITIQLGKKQLQNVLGWQPWEAGIRDTEPTEARVL